MKLNEILNEMRPGAEAIASHGLKLQDGVRALYLTCAVVALEKNGGDHTRAAESLGISKGYLSKIINGGAKLTRAPKSSAWGKLHAGKTPAEVLGEMQI